MSAVVQVRKLGVMETSFPEPAVHTQVVTILRDDT